LYGGQVEIRNNIKIQISNDKNIPDTYTTSIGSSKSFEFGISVIRICFVFRISIFEFLTFFQHMILFNSECHFFE